MIDDLLEALGAMRWLLWGFQRSRWRGRIAGVFDVVLV
jgi:hypothetical protein